MSTYKTEGIVLVRKDFREADRRVTIYTRDYGKIEAVAQGARKIKSKMAGHLEPPSRVSLFVAQGKNFERIAGVKSLKSYPKLRSHLESILATQYLLRILDTFTHLKLPDKRLFQLLSKTLDFIDRYSKPGQENYLKSLLIVQAFVVKFLALLGLKPQLYSCVSCKNRIKPQKFYFDTEKGGLICTKHAGRGIRLKPDSVKLLRLLLKSKFEEISRIKVRLEIFKEVQKTINIFLEYYSEKDLKIHGQGQKI